jgi:hypothetical protein
VSLDAEQDMDAATYGQVHNLSSNGSNVLQTFTSSDPSLNVIDGLSLDSADNLFIANTDGQRVVNWPATDLL